MTAPTAALPALVYDGDCGFCTTSALWLSGGRRRAFTAIAWQALPDLGAVGLSVAMVQDAAYWLRDGQVQAEGSAAIAAALRARGGAARVLGLLLAAPGVRQAARVVYRIVARHRHRMPGGTSACRVDLR